MNNDFWRQWQALAAVGPFPWRTGGNPSPGFAPFAESAEHFAAALREFTAAAERAAQPSATASQTAFAAAEQFGNFLRDHFAATMKPPWPPAPGATATAGAAFAQAPPLGLGREQMLRAERAAEAWNRLTEAQSRLQRMWSDCLREAAAAFTARLGQAASEPITTEAMEQIYDLWIACAEDAYARTAHGDAFGDALSAYVNAGAEWRRESAAGVEEWAKLWDLPTRSEVNALIHRMRELEAQLATMRAAARSARSAKPRVDANPRARAKARAPRKKRRP